MITSINSFQQMLYAIQAAVMFGCISVPDGGVCFDRVAGLQDGYLNLSLTLVGLYILLLLLNISLSL